MRRATLLLSISLLLSTAVFGSEISLQGRHAGDQHGEIHDLEELARGLLVVDFAASWCEPCYEALPKLEALARTHPEVRFVVVSVDETRAGRDRLVRDLGLELPVLWDEGQRIVEGFSPEGFPATYVLDHGRVIHQHIGSDENGWRELVAVLGGGRKGVRSRSANPQVTRSEPLDPDQ